MPDPLLYEINTRWWLNELSDRHGGPVTLADVPDSEFARWRQLGELEQAHAARLALSGCRDAQAARIEAARLEAARTEAARQEAVRAEAARQAALREEALRQEAQRQESARHKDAA